MPVDDRTRLNLHRKLEAVLGPEEADTLMAHLPSVTWNDVATKDDLHVLERTLRSEMHALDAGLRGEITGVCGELHALDASLRGEIANAITTQTKWMVTFAAAWSTLLITAVRLLP